MILRNENPRPNLIRNNNDFLNLNGEWEFEFDENNVGLKEKWFENHNFSKKIIVPFAYESIASEIHDNTKHDYIWYKKDLEITKIDATKRYLLNFNGIDYCSKIYINGYLVKEHIGSSSRINVEISDYIKEGKNEIVVYVFDPMTLQDIPRGKQFWEEESKSIFYTKTSGIYKNVYLEVVPKNYLEDYHITSDIDNGTIDVSLFNKGIFNKVEYTISLNNEVINKVIKYNSHNEEKIYATLQVWDNQNLLKRAFHDEDYCWTPKKPLLYDLTIKLYVDDVLEDEVSTYFAMRKVSIKNGIFYLNNRPYIQKLVLDQGYFKKGLLSYTNISELEEDIKLAKEMGFNGARMHQKVEEPYYYYLCDKLGFIAWLEFPAAQIYNRDLVTRQTIEWMEVVKQNYNHPSIFVYVPLNESWGIPYVSKDKKQEYFENAMYNLTKSLDDSRLCVGNDGWELSSTDIYSIHNYMHGAKGNEKAYRDFKLALKDRESMLTSSPSGRSILLGKEDPNVPVMLTEFGGVSFQKDSKEGWGYTSVNNEDDYLAELAKIYQAIKESSSIVGYCYTQLYDVEQEINGLLTYDRVPKCNLEDIKKLNDSIDCFLQIVK